MVKTYTDDEIRKYSQHPLVLQVTRKRLSLTLEFRQRIYDTWILHPCATTVRTILEENGFDTKAIGRDFYNNIVKGFKRNGRPTREYWSRNVSEDDRAETSSANAVEIRETHSAHSKEDLVNTGKFTFSGRGVCFTQEFEAELFSRYPECSIDQGLANAGFDPGEISYHLKKKLKTVFEESIAIGSDYANTRRKGDEIAEDDLKLLRMNPFVEDVTGDGVALEGCFFQAAAPLRDQPIDDILEVFFIRHSLLTHDEKKRASSAIRSLCKAVPAQLDGKTVLTLCILYRRERALAREAAKGFEQMGRLFPSMKPMEKKQICLWIHSLPKDPGKVFTRTEIIRRIGIHRSVYYKYVGDEDFGMSEERKRSKEETDEKAVRFVWEYKGFRKGYRQVYMMLPRLTDRIIGLKRVRRIMREHGMDSGIRRPNPARERAAEREEKTVKPDLLRRRFRLYRPNVVRVTDVTVLDYGERSGEKRLRAYGSALMDPVTDRLLAFVVSGNNDLGMALETLRESDKYPCIDGGIFHSDQGVLYKSDEFQGALLDRGLQQSMSKKGNCWDNATQESFFGHFKDECPYEKCQDIEDLKKKVAEYEDYYNNERGMWDRGRMTPVEYEDYLLSMDDIEFAGYLAQEEEKYNEMKRRAAELAKKRYGTLGV